MIGNFRKIPIKWNISLKMRDQEEKILIKPYFSIINNMEERILLKKLNEDWNGTFTQSYKHVDSNALNLLPQEEFQEDYD